MTAMDLEWCVELNTMFEREAFKTVAMMEFLKKRKEKKRIILPPIPQQGKTQANNTSNGKKNMVRNPQFVPPRTVTQVVSMQITVLFKMICPYLLI